MLLDFADSIFLLASHFNTFSQKDVLFTVFGFLENCSIVVLHTKSNRSLLKTRAIVSLWALPLRGIN